MKSISNFAVIAGWLALSLTMLYSTRLSATEQSSTAWTHIYAGDYAASTLDGYRQLAALGVNGFAWQWRNQWKAFDADQPSRNATLGTVRQALQVIQTAHRELDMEFMLLLHLYAVGGPRRDAWFDCSRPDDLKALNERCRLAASYGVHHIMICADDWTPMENGRYVLPTAGERQAFGDSAGRAHGTLMRYLAEQAGAAYPQLHLSFCSPVYSSRRHHLDDPRAQRYLLDFDGAAPASVSLVWTGGQVVTHDLLREDFLQYTRCLPSSRRLVYWDNSEGFDSPVPLWSTTWYPEASADHDGTIFLNAHALGVPFCLPYIASAVETPRHGDNTPAPAAYHHVLVQMFGETDAGQLETWRAAYHDLLIAMDGNDRTRQKALLDRTEQLLKNIAPGDRRLANLHAAVAKLHARLDFPPREITLPQLSAETEFPGRAASFVLERNDRGRPATPATTVAMALVKDELFLQFQCEQPALASITRPVIRSHDDTVWLNAEAVEIFLQPGEGAYGHFIFDCFGNRADEKGREGVDSWNPDWQVVISPRPNGYQALVRIPLNELELLGVTPPAPGVRWRFNLFRAPYRAPVQAFSPVGANGYHSPKLFGAAKIVRN